jgi:aminoglycoside phosphotransferase (APT) family kinase protein
MPANDEYDQQQVRARLEPWRSDRYGEPVAITGLAAPGSSGFSSETMLVDLAVGGRDERLVIRGEPMAFRVFPTYDLWSQYRCMQAVRAHSATPMPELKWFEGDTSVLGHTFYAMERVDGEAAPDNLPYTIDGFLYEATPADQERLYRSSIRTLAGLHAIDVDAAGLRFLDRPDDGRTGLDQQLAYYERFIPYATEGEPHPILDAGWQWLLDNRPPDHPEGLSWGDSRIGNMLFRDFEPVAVLDWEMAYLGPREQDVAWFFFFFRFFSDVLGLPDLPGFPAEQEGLAYYEEVSGHRLQDFEWFTAWAAFRYAVIMVRLMHRPNVRANSPAEWTLVDNPFTKAFADRIGMPMPEG